MSNRIRRTARRGLALTLVGALGGCGGSPEINPNGYAVFFRPATVTLSSIILPRASVCGLPFVAATGVVEATIEGPARPDPFFLELLRGTCDAPGDVVVASPTGEFMHEVSAGTYFVRITNTSDETVPFILEVSYLLPPNAPAP